MQVKATLSSVRISPRKVRLVANAIRGLEVPKAKIQLQFLVKKSSAPILKLLHSAEANARHNFKLNPDEMYVSEIFVNEGQSFRRGVSQSRGRVHQIRKRTSHIHLTLSEKKDRNPKSGVADKVVAEKKKKADSDVHKEKKESAKQVVAPSKTKKRLVGISRRAFHAHE
ncbi:50S ribosomal protein L22 [Candidatus Azambacteria bacterium]|nr:50S ribosomal protein L22 [Candidatus Azambacteria bacterium]MBI3684893.1 50S ribosomal protein L22 [Candidatus Azambacteria bacterium]